MMDMHIHVRGLLDDNETFCEYVNKFNKYNINEVCFLEHSKRISLKHIGYLNDDKSYYNLICLVNCFKEKYDNLDVYSGIEIDYSNDKEFRKDILNYIKKYKFDYVVGSVHGFKSLDSYKYYEMVIDMINNYPIDIIGHLRLFDTWENDKDMLMKIIVLCSEKNIKIEINTSARSLWSLEQFEFMFDNMKKYDVCYTVGSDAHDVSQIGQNYELVSKLLKR